MFNIIHHLGFCYRALHTATNGTSLVSLLGIGAYDSIIKAVEMAEKAANESKRAADQTLKVTSGLLVRVIKKICVFIENINAIFE